jgi:hypothetical protein
MDATTIALRWCAAALIGCAATSAHAQTLQAKAKEMACTDRPERIAGTQLYKCTQRSGFQAFFDVPDASPDTGATTRSTPSGTTRSATVPTPSTFPKVDAGTQKSRDDLRRRVLMDELASEERLLAEARKAYGEGSPPPLPEESGSAQKYADRTGGGRCVGAAPREGGIDDPRLRSPPRPTRDDSFHAVRSRRPPARLLLNHGVPARSRARS